MIETRKLSLQTSRHLEGRNASRACRGGYVKVWKQDSPQNIQEDYLTTE